VNPIGSAAGDRRSGVGGRDARGAAETAQVLLATDRDEVYREQYGEAKVACERASRDTVDDRLLVSSAGLSGGPGDQSGRFRLLGRPRLA